MLNYYTTHPTDLSSTFFKFLKKVFGILSPALHRMVWMSIFHQFHQKGEEISMCYTSNNTTNERKPIAALVQAEPLCRSLPAAPDERRTEVQDLDDCLFRWETQAPTVSNRGGGFVGPPGVCSGEVRFFLVFRLLFSKTSDIMNQLIISECE